MSRFIKHVFSVLIILSFISTASATDLGQLSSDTIFNFSAIGVNITVLAPQNFSQIQYTTTPTNTLEFTINGSTIQFNSTTDKTISNISYLNDVWQWNTSTAGYINVTTKSQYNFANYSIYKNATLISTNLSDSVGNISFNTSSSLGANFSVRRVSGIPALISPANQSIQTISYLPYAQTFTWSNEGSTQYDIDIAKDSAFSIIVSSITVTSNTTSISMWDTSQYFWRVRTRSGTTTGTWSEVFNFELTETALPSSDGTTGIQGIVYEVRSTGNLVLSSARVEISNSTWTGSTTTGTNGYYLFKNLKNQSVYSLRATKTGYANSNDELVTTINGTWAIKNIYMQSCVSNYYGSNCGTLQNVRFIVQNIWGTEYAGVTTNVYRGSETTVVDTGNTGSDGSITFMLFKDLVYRLTFVNSTIGINQELTVKPADIEYYIIIPYTTEYFYKNTSYSEAGTVNVSVNTTINSTGTGFINVAYNDALSQTSNLLIHINQTNASDPTNQTLLQSYNGGSNSVYSISYTVNSPSSKSFIVNVKADHTTFGSIARSYGIHFRGMPTTDLDFIPAWFKAFMAVGILFFVAAFAGATSHNQIAGLVCVLGWIFFGFGWFNSLGGQYSLGIPAGLTLATIVVVIANMKERAEKEGLG